MDRYDPLSTFGAAKVDSKREALVIDMAVDGPLAEVCSDVQFVHMQFVSGVKSRVVSINESDYQGRLSVVATSVSSRMGGTCPSGEIEYQVDIARVCSL